MFIFKECAFLSETTKLHHFSLVRSEFCKENNGPKRVASSKKNMKMIDLPCQLIMQHQIAKWIKIRAKLLRKCIVSPQLSKGKKKTSNSWALPWGQQINEWRHLQPVIQQVCPLVSVHCCKYGKGTCFVEAPHCLCRSVQRAIQLTLLLGISALVNPCTVGTVPHRAIGNVKWQHRGCLGGTIMQWLFC